MFVRDLVTGRRQASACSAACWPARPQPPPTLATAADAAPVAAPGGKPGKRGSQPLDFANPVDNLYAFGKIWSGYEQPVIGGSRPDVPAHAGQRLVPVFGFTGTGVLQAEFDPKGALKVKSRETGLFLRPAQRRHPSSTGTIR